MLSEYYKTVLAKYLTLKYKYKYKYKYSGHKYKYKYKYSGHKYEYEYKYFETVLEYYSSTSTSTKYYISVLERLSATCKNCVAVVYTTDVTRHMSIVHLPYVHTTEPV